MNKKTACPVCHYMMDGHSGAYKEDEHLEPRPGDVSLCLMCASVLVFDENMNLNTPDDQKLMELMVDVPSWQRLQKAREGIRFVMGRRLKKAK